MDIPTYMIMILHDMYPPYIPSWAYLRKPTYVSSPPACGLQEWDNRHQHSDNATATQRQRNRALATRPSSTRPCDCKNARDVEMKPMENLMRQTPRHLTDSLRKLDSHKLLDNDIDGQLIKGLTQEWNDGTRILRCDGTTCLAHAPHGYGFRV